MKIVAVVGARPNFMKIAPIMWEIRRRGNIDAFLVHTGQHYDRQMSELFFDELKIPRPDIDLGVGSASHAVQTAEVMKRFEPVVNEQRPDLVMVVGDVNSTVACALTSVKLGVPVAHVEAGLRSFDRAMPEEINRIVTDTISRWLFVTEKSGMTNLHREGISNDRMFLVGNVMIDTLMASRESIEKSSILQQLQLDERNYAVLTLHRPSNVDDPKALSGLLKVFNRLQRELTIVFPVHPRTRAVLESCNIPAGLKLISPLGYLDFMKLVAHSRVVLTDSGGIQEETTVLGVPCLTLRENTERPATVEEGTNILVGSNPEKIASAWRAAIDQPKAGRVPELWDGHAAKRIIDILK